MTLQTTFPSSHPDSSAKLYEGVIRKGFKPIAPYTTEFGGDEWKNSRVCDLAGPYAYALDRATIGASQLGLLDSDEETRGPLELLSLQKIMKLAHHDGLHPLGDIFPEGNDHIIAFMFSEVIGSRPSELLPLRRDNSGTFSYKAYQDKQGCAARPFPINFDNNGKKITDPRTANLGRFCHFGGFASVDWTEGYLFREKVSIPEFPVLNGTEYTEVGGKYIPTNDMPKIHSATQPLTIPNEDILIKEG